MCTHLLATPEVIPIVVLGSYRRRARRGRTRWCPAPDGLPPITGRVLASTMTWTFAGEPVVAAEGFVLAVADRGQSVGHGPQPVSRLGWSGLHGRPRRVPLPPRSRTVFSSRARCFTLQPVNVSIRTRSALNTPAPHGRRSVHGRMRHALVQAVDAVAQAAVAGLSFEECLVFVGHVDPDVVGPTDDVCVEGKAHRSGSVAPGAAALEVQ